MKNKIRAFAFYLPQYYPIPENDEWWEKGFTEWTNVTKAKPLYPGHHQPNLPSELGFYDLRIPENRELQANLAQTYGIEGFCYWHYWFGNGKTLLDRVFNEVLSSGKPDYPFCLAWANETWQGKWHGMDDQILIEQNYPGDEDYISHFYKILPALKDERYVKVNGKPLFMVYKPFLLPNAKHFIELWQKLAKENGLKGIYFVGQTDNFRLNNDVLSLGFNAVNEIRLAEIVRTYSHIKPSLKQRLYYKFNNIPRHLRKYDYATILHLFTGKEIKEKNIIPTIIPNWDHTPRSHGKTMIVEGSTPFLFKKHAKQVIDLIMHKPKEERILFIKSWNEWAEGNYMEPDRRFGRQYLEAFKDVSTE